MASRSPDPQADAAPGRTLPVGRTAARPDLVSSDRGTLALEATYLLDRDLTKVAVDQELGALLADERMGEEYIETLEAYLSSGQNSRETARRLHLSPRTVTYRLERIVSLLGEPLDSAASLRLGAALLARVSHRKRVGRTYSSRGHTAGAARSNLME